MYILLYSKWYAAELAIRGKLHVKKAAQHSLLFLPTFPFTIEVRKGLKNLNGKAFLLLNVFLSLFLWFLKQRFFIYTLCSNYPKLVNVYPYLKAALAQNGTVITTFL